MSVSGSQARPEGAGVKPSMHWQEWKTSAATSVAAAVAAAAELRTGTRSSGLQTVLLSSEQWEAMRQRELRREDLTMGSRQSTSTSPCKR